MNIKQLRNIGIIAHVDAGKTTLTERILFYAGESHAIGDTHMGNTKTDFEPEEKQKGITISSAAVSVHWRDHRITIIDTPGHIDFNIEVNRSLRVLDGAVVVFDGVAGVEPQSETNWNLADEYGVPRLCFVNKLDRTGADFFHVVDAIKSQLGANTVIMQLPIGKEEAYIGLVDLITMKTLYWDRDSSGSEFRTTDIPEEMLEQANKYRDKLLDQVVEFEQTAMEAYLQGSEAAEKDIRLAIRNGTLSGSLIPVLCGAAYKNRGVQPLLDAIVDYLPSPIDVDAIKCIAEEGEKSRFRHNDENEPFSALAFKIINDKFGVLTFLRAYSGNLVAGSSVVNTVSGKKERISRIYEMQANKRKERQSIRAGDIVAVVGLKQTVTGDTLSDPKDPVVLERLIFPEPVIDVALEPKTRNDQDKLVQSLHQLIKEDPSLRIKVDSETGQTILSGMGELHLEIKIGRLVSHYGVSASVGAPRVAYRETITASCDINHRIKKQGGGPGTFAAVEMHFHALERGSGIEFENKVTGGVIPREYIPSVEKGIRNAANSGVLAGYASVDFKAILLGGDFHEVDSSTYAFELVGQEAYRKAMPLAKPVLLEPVMQVEVKTPGESLGDCIGDLSRRRGKIISQEMLGEKNVIQAYVPLAEMFGYIGDLRSLSSGRASFTMEYKHYDRVPENLVKHLVL